LYWWTLKNGFNPNEAHLEALSAEIGKPKSNVGRWFTQRRFRLRKDLASQLLDNSTNNAIYGFFILFLSIFSFSAQLVVNKL